MKTTIMMNGKINGEKWYHIDAENKVLGRLASKIACIVRGKETPEFQGDVNPMIFVVVTNANKVKLTGLKSLNKTYHRHTGYVGGIKSTTYDKMIVKHPTFPLEKAIKGMLPKNRLGRKLLKQVKLFASAEHHHGSQKPETITF